jgi:hypothetical protein
MEKRKYVILEQSRKASTRKHSSTNASPLSTSQATSTAPTGSSDSTHSATAPFVALLKDGLQGVMKTAKESTSESKLVVKVSSVSIPAAPAPKKGKTIAILGGVQSII